MASRPNRTDLERALSAAGAAHHDYEVNYFNGERDEQWPGWYAAYVLGRLGDFATPTSLTRWLVTAPAGNVWSASAAEHVLSLLPRR